MKKIKILSDPIIYVKDVRNKLKKQSIPVRIFMLLLGDWPDKKTFFFM